MEQHPPQHLSVHESMHHNCRRNLATFVGLCRLLTGVMCVFSRAGQEGPTTMEVETALGAQTGERGSHIVWKRGKHPPRARLEIYRGCTRKESPVHSNGDPMEVVAPRACLWNPLRSPESNMGFDFKVENNYAAKEESASFFVLPSREGGRWERPK